MPLDASALVTLRAVSDRLIPRDEFPGATDTGVEHYIVRQLSGDLSAEEPLVAAGLLAVEAAANAQHGCAFTALSDAQQDTVLQTIETDTSTSQFFNRLVELAAEGFYSDPGSGGNRDEVSWRMIGYSRRLPDKPTAP